MSSGWATSLSDLVWTPAGIVLVMLGGLLVLIVGGIVVAGLLGLWHGRSRRPTEGERASDQQ